MQTKPVVAGEPVFYEYVSPVGTLTLTETNETLTRLDFGAHSQCAVSPALSPPTPLLAEAVRQLDAYFSGTRKTFDLPLALRGTPFQLRVWEALRAIPYGETRCYAEIAQAVGSPKGFRAVGMANHNNPLAIFIPCHRVVGKRGDLVGFAGGLDTKQALLSLETAHTGV